MQGDNAKPTNLLESIGATGKVGVGFALSPWLEDSPVPLERGTVLVADIVD